MAILKSLKDGPLSPEEVANRTGRPLYSVRSGLKKLKNAGFVKETNGKYKLSEKGQKAA
ncbi:MAG: helix-turn-helix domain-containing protein [Nitrososphaerota archaeon]|nr:hypothetical protein [Candidatus Bathyarchaeota archaeon]MDW8023524.1 helix-turn-helix domain-containing protein [Nitrososphaerota archaeon]